VDALNEFGQQGGFTKILDMMRSAAAGKFHLSLTHLASLCTFLCKTQPMWHKQFACSYIQEMTKALLQVLCYINEEATDANKHQLILGPCQEDAFEAPVLEMMINMLVDPIWRRYYTLEMLSKIQSEYRLEIGTALLRLPSLKKRIQGIKYINEAIRTVR